MKKFLIFAVIIAVVVGLPLAKSKFKGHSEKGVEVEVLKTQVIKASILASGQLKHELEVKLTAEVIGKVSKLHVVEGQVVTKGQLLLEIDDQAYIAEVQRQQALVDQQKVAIERQQFVVKDLNKQLERKSKLYRQKLIDDGNFDMVKHSHNLSTVDLKGAREVLKQVEASLKQSQDKLSKTKILSPINGSITSLDIKVGETAISSTTNIEGSSLMTIADPQSMLAQINVDEADIASVMVGQQAEIIAIAFADQPLMGTVEYIASSAKRARGRQNYSFAVKLKLEEGNGVNLHPGMSCRAEVFTQEQQALLAVPLRALHTVEDNENDVVENFVFVLKDGIANKIKVDIGISDDAYQHIIKGLSAGANIITGPDKVVRHLKDGEKVTIVDKLGE